MASSSAFTSVVLDSLLASSELANVAFVLKSLKHSVLPRITKESELASIFKVMKSALTSHAKTAAGSGYSKIPRVQLLLVLEVVLNADFSAFLKSSSTLTDLIKGLINKCVCDILENGRLSFFHEAFRVASSYLRLLHRCSSSMPELISHETSKEGSVTKLVHAAYFHLECHDLDRGAETSCWSLILQACQLFPGSVRPSLDKIWKLAIVNFTDVETCYGRFTPIIAQLLVAICKASSKQKCMPLWKSTCDQLFGAWKICQMQLTYCSLKANNSNSGAMADDFNGGIPFPPSQDRLNVCLASLHNQLESLVVAIEALLSQFKGPAFNDFLPISVEMLFNQISEVLLMEPDSLLEVSASSISVDPLHLNLEAHLIPVLQLKYWSFLSFLVKHGASSFSLLLGKFTNLVNVILEGKNTHLPLTRAILKFIEKAAIPVFGPAFIASTCNVFFQYCCVQLASGSEPDESVLALLQVYLSHSAPFVDSRLAFKVDVLLAKQSISTRSASLRYQLLLCIKSALLADSSLHCGLLPIGIKLFNQSLVSPVLALRKLAQDALIQLDLISQPRRIVKKSFFKVERSSFEPTSAANDEPADVKVPEESEKEVSEDEMEDEMEVDNEIVQQEPTEDVVVPAKALVKERKPDFTSSFIESIAKKEEPLEKKVKLQNIVSEVVVKSDDDAESNVDDELSDLDLAINEDDPSDIE